MIRISASTVCVILFSKRRIWLGTQLFHHLEMTAIFIHTVVPLLQGTIMFGRNGFAGVSNYSGVSIYFHSAGIRKLSVSTLDSWLLITFGVFYWSRVH